MQTNLMSLPFGLKPLFVAGAAADGIGLLLHIVGIATKYWSTAVIYINYFTKINVNFGLFQYCSGVCTEYTQLPESYTSGAQKATAALAIIGMLQALLAIAVAAVRVVKPTLQAGEKISGGVSIAAFVTIILGVIVWGARANHDQLKIIYGRLGTTITIGYSLGLSTAGAVFLLIGGICMLLSTRLNIASPSLPSQHTINKI